MGLVFVTREQTQLCCRGGARRPLLSQPSTSTLSLLCRQTPSVSAASWRPWDQGAWFRLYVPQAVAEELPFCCVDTTASRRFTCRLAMFNPP